MVATSCFTFNLPPRLSDRGFSGSLASSIASWLKLNGCHGEVLCEQQCHDSVGSVFFVLKICAKTLSIFNVTFITSAFHVPRVEVMADQINKIVFNCAFLIRVVGVDDPVDIEVMKNHEVHSVSLFKRTFGSVVSQNEFLSS